MSGNITDANFHSAITVEEQCKILWKQNWSTVKYLLPNKTVTPPLGVIWVWNNTNTYMNTYLMAFDPLSTSALRVTGKNPRPIARNRRSRKLPMAISGFLWLDNDNRVTTATPMCSALTKDLLSVKFIWNIKIYLFFCIWNYYNFFVFLTNYFPICEVIKRFCFLLRVPHFSIQSTFTQLYNKPQN